MKCKSFACCAIAALALLVACGEDSTSLLQTVEKLEAQGDYAGAAAELSAGLRTAPQNGVLRYHLGRMYSLQFDWPMAEHEFRKGMEAGSVEGGRIALGLGRALVRQRKYREAITDVTAAPAFEQRILASVHALRGYAMLNLNRIGDAKKELDAAAKVDPNNADGILLRAQLRAGARDVAGALQLVERVVAQEPRNVDGWIDHAHLLAIAGKPQEALVSLGNVLPIQPRHLDALVGRASILVQLGRLGDAQKDVDTLRKAYPKHPATAYLRGQIAYWRGEYRQALDMAQAALKADEHDNPARLLSGMAHLMLDEPVQAEHEFGRYVTSQPRDVAVQRVLTDLRAEIGRKGTQAKGLGSVHADDLRKASVQAVFGDAYIRVWQHSNVAAWLERVAGSAPADPLFTVKQTKQRFTREQLELAASDLERAAAMSDEFKPADWALVIVRLAQGNTTKAMDSVSAMESKSPNDPQVATLAGMVSMQRNQREEAGRRFDEALQRDPKLLAAVLGRARVDISAGNVDLARKRFEDTLRADPDNLNALVLFALFEEATRRRTEAHGLLQRALKAHPKALEPQIVLLALLKKENAKARATAVADEMLAAHPSDPIAIEMAADIQLWNGDRERGLATLQRLVTVSPKSPESYYKLAKAQFDLGLKAEADANLQRALALPINDPDAGEIAVSGFVDDTRTVEAIETARKSFKTPAATNRAQLGAQLGMGGSALSDALSGTAANRK